MIINNNSQQLQLKKKKRDQYKRDSRKAAFQGRSSSSDKDKQRLSIVKEEPEVPRGRGDSYWDDGAGTLSKVCASITDEFGDGNTTDDEDEDDGRGDDVIDTPDENDIISSSIIKEEGEEEEGGSSSSTSGNNKLHIGALVGIQLSQTIHSSSSVGASTSGRSYSGNNNSNGKSAVPSICTASIYYH